MLLYIQRTFPLLFFELCTKVNFRTLFFAHVVSIRGILHRALRLLFQRNVFVLDIFTCQIIKLSYYFIRHSLFFQLNVIWFGINRVFFNDRVWLRYSLVDIAVDTWYVALCLLVFNELFHIRCHFKEGEFVWTLGKPNMEQFFVSQKLVQGLLASSVWTFHFSKHVSYD